MVKTSFVDRVNVLGLPVDCVAPEHLENVLENLCNKNSRNQKIVFVDHKILLKARRNPEWMSFISDAALVVPLNYTLTNAIKLFYNKKSYPYLQLDVLLSLLNVLEKRSASVYLLGSRPDILQTADLNLRKTYPGLRFVGRHAGYFNKKTQSIILESIRKSSPSLLVASRGIKEKELWLYRHEHKLKSKFFLFSTDCFDIFANKKSRSFIKKWGLFSIIFTLIFQPWSILRIFPFFIFYVNLIFNRVKIKTC